MFRFIDITRHLMSMSRSSIYDTLPTTRSIRLLNLQPGSGDEPLTCRLVIVKDLTSAPELHALSYC
ncbi:hypothetical protein GQ44DRAFT_715255 [Phaeosphaeriaceae sp. PMI808]|nr:hypothetical protein GQ44DRAFT_715255 [Phaeosphaeriaceae sp. PMI808]